MIHRPSDLFLSCDWGTSRFRLRLVDIASLVIVKETHTDDGIASLAAAGCSVADYFHQQKGRLLEGHTEASVPAVIGGMAGSRAGWKELPYAELPLDLASPELIVEVIEPDVLLVSGVRDTCNVMRGEELQAIGLAALHPEILDSERALLVLPGTHSKHLMLSRGLVSGFTTWMTGELFSHLPNMPTLRPCVGEETELDLPVFKRGAREGYENGLTASLFKLRALTLLGELQMTQTRSFLSGLLIGDELTSIPLDMQIFIAATPPLSGHYRAAAAANGLSKLVFLSDDATERSILHAQRKILLQRN